MKYINGKSRLEDYKCIDVLLDLPRKKLLNTIQFTFGGFMESETSECESKFRVLKHSLRQLIANKSKDGYYSHNFIFIPKIGDTYKVKGKGLVYFEVFLYLEETYERGFIIDHLKTLFQEIDIMYQSHNFFKFSKYKPKRVTKDAKDTNNIGV